VNVNRCTVQIQEQDETLQFPFIVQIVDTLCYTVESIQINKHAMNVVCTYEYEPEYHFVTEYHFVHVQAA
jgi:hypothetical protein